MAFRSSDVVPYRPNKVCPTIDTNPHSSTRVVGVAFAAVGPEPLPRDRMTHRMNIVHRSLIRPIGHLDASFFLPPAPVTCFGATRTRKASRASATETNPPLRSVRYNPSYRLNQGLLAPHEPEPDFVHQTQKIRRLRYRNDKPVSLHCPWHSRPSDRRCIFHRLDPAQPRSEEFLDASVMIPLGKLGP